MISVLISVVEGLACSFFVLLVCVIGIANGPENMVFFYDEAVQKRVVELKLISEKRIRHNKTLFFLTLIPYFTFAIYCVYVLTIPEASLTVSYSLPSFY